MQFSFYIRGFSITAKDKGRDWRRGRSFSREFFKIARVRPFPVYSPRETSFMREAKPRLLDDDALWAYAVRLLAGRAHSQGELREKLRRRAARAGAVDEAMARLKEDGYLDDRKFAEGFAAARLANDKLGRGRVIRDLRQRRVAPALAEQTVHQVYRNVNEEALIEDWVRRKYRLTPPQKLFREDKDMAAAYRRLLHAGFRAGDILRVLKRFARNPELLETFEAPEDSFETE
jgi:regulatory protein